MKTQSEPHTVSEPSTLEEVEQGDNAVIKRILAIENVRKRMIEFICWARAGDLVPLRAFVTVSRQSNATPDLIFDSFAEIVPGLERAEFEAFLKD